VGCDENPVLGSIRKALKRFRGVDGFANLIFGEPSFNSRWGTRPCGREESIYAGHVTVTSRYSRINPATTVDATQAARVDVDQRRWSPVRRIVGNASQQDGEACGRCNARTVSGGDSRGSASGRAILARGSCRYSFRRLRVAPNPARDVNDAGDGGPLPVDAWGHGCGVAPAHGKEKHGASPPTWTPTPTKSLGRAGMLASSSRSAGGDGRSSGEVRALCRFQLSRIAQRLLSPAGRERLALQMLGSTLDTVTSAILDRLDGGFDPIPQRSPDSFVLGLLGRGPN
jgi:hypothetical protein